jgi:hypothetical protein
MEKGKMMTLKKALSMSVEHLLKCNLVQADLNTALVEDLQILRKRILQLEAMVDLHEERFVSQIKKGK